MEGKKDKKIVGGSVVPRCVSVQFLGCSSSTRIGSHNGVTLARAAV